CCRFVPHYADRVSLLRPLTHKDKPFAWTDKHQKQLDALKGVIRDVPYLFEPNGDGKFVLECDASDYAVGATLYQWQTPEITREEKSADNAPADVLRPLDHFSRTFRGSEKNWCIAEKELFAVKVSIENWDHWLYGHQFEVLTDHKNLVYLFNDPTRDAGNRRWARWAVSLQQYSFTVSYVKGEENKVADYLSREGPDVLAAKVTKKLGAATRMNRTRWIGVKPKQLWRNVPIWSVERVKVPFAKQLAPAICDEDREINQEIDKARAKVLSHTHKMKKIFDPKRLLEMQCLDPFLGIIREELKSGYSGELEDLPQAMRTAFRKGAYKLDAHTSLIMWRGLDRTETPVVEMPGVLVSEALGFAHLGTHGMHRGWGGMRKSLREVCHWTGINANCRDYAAGCQLCQEHNPGRGEGLQGKFIPIRAKRPFDLLAVDVVGPLPPSVGGYRYLLTVLDHYSRYIQVYPMATVGALETALTLLENWI
ncbi:MAG: hypothetical protein GY737_30120, partial [Desulfobacteraceae bacterium]|nr:hypothetical protein [Desulfobacteraceae bacterium]